MGEVGEKDVVGGDLPPTKTCTKCGEEKPISDFYKAKGGKFGVRADCKGCKRVKTRQHRADNPDYWPTYYAENKDHVLQRSAEWREKNPERAKENVARWRKQNPSSHIEYYEQNSEKILAQRALKRSENPEHFRTYARNHKRKRRAESPQVRLEDAVRGAVIKSIRRGAKAGRKTFEILGYTISDLKNHLEKKFTEGMKWENYGRYGWHVDHVIPLSAHNYDSPDDIDFKRAWALSNLQPLWWDDNLSKRDDLPPGGFQPSLKI